VKRAWIWLLTLGLLALPLMACGSGDDDDDDDTSGGDDQPTLVIARDMDINSLDPARAYCDTCQIYLSATYETLIGLDPKDNKTFIPRLAEKWSVNKDSTEYTFNLEKDAKFADGSAVEAKDVKWSWERLANQGLGGLLHGRHHEHRSQGFLHRRGETTGARLSVLREGECALRGDHQQRTRGSERCERR
jgi:ABC-type transport system substrate-binding protein